MKEASEEADRLLREEEENALKTLQKSKML